MSFLRHRKRTICSICILEGYSCEIQIDICYLDCIPAFITPRSPAKQGRAKPPLQPIANQARGGNIDDSISTHCNWQNMDPYYYTQKRHHRRRRLHRPIIRLIASSLPSSSSSLQLLLLFIVISSICNNIPTTNGFAAWFVDRKVSCYTTNLAANEIIMNNAVIPYSDSLEPNIYLNVSPINNENEIDATNANNANKKNAGPNSEYVVKFVVPEKNDKSLADLQYVLELVNGAGKDDTKDDGGDNVAAKFTSAHPGGGGIGCEGKRSHGKVNGQYVSAAIFTINSNANDGDTIEIVGGWATGHEAVTLTEKVVLVVGQGIIVGGGGGDFHDDDDAPLDDEEWDELEEAFIEEEREEIDNEIELAEEDAVEALEEKRQETDGLASEINTAEEEIVEEFERNRKDVNEVLDALEDEIFAKKESTERGGIKPDHKHTRSERREAERKHREEHDRKHTDEDKLQEMYRTLNKKKQNAKQREYDSLKAQKDKIEELMDMESALKDSVDKLHTMDKKEHDKARREHIKPLPKAELNVDMSELKQKAKQRMQMLSDKLGYASDKLGVNELLNDPKVQEIRGKLRKGVPRGGKDGYSRDVGQPLPPEGRHFLFVFFSLFGLVGLIRWAFDKRRRKSTNKGKRTL